MGETNNLGVWYGVLWVRVVRSAFEDILDKFDLIRRNRYERMALRFNTKKYVCKGCFKLVLLRISLNCHGCSSEITHRTKPIDYIGFTAPFIQDLYYTFICCTVLFA
ncbi:hypothetical protein VCUG_02322 [Vavraia culicis subsp. floridensis]|uniref:Uncharacterized protein n=1 Tax=Vavraia culicis (isolate floridensis) TaxID=948595 RepID=L2GR99_VAVCU|nr:uncharacterized protein VCUG_02322 [Vavraia culicis subsp. floridensis]ELA46186.1 hypothetical protein VCUG_02322 [Vavraia culicis subsp. floridensis]